MAVREYYEKMLTSGTDLPANKGNGEHNKKLGRQRTSVEVTVALVTGRYLTPQSSRSRPSHELGTYLLAEPMPPDATPLRIKDPAALALTYRASPLLAWPLSRRVTTQLVVAALGSEPRFPKSLNLFHLFRCFSFAGLFDYNPRLLFVRSSPAIQVTKCLSLKGSVSTPSLKSTATLYYPSRAPTWDDSTNCPSVRCTYMTLNPATIHVPSPKLSHRTVIATALAPVAKPYHPLVPKTRVLLLDYVNALSRTTW
ncbi:hypothetical protein B0T10DRAFT_460570 [Thelonectria olida]|uniref:Uncharacterized protein n=1 Tax=Thelonectria olida TaxID=1576542 RepID=A0A9P9ANC9_9HYPO|nr:hypothetical protein B0T10DRAFT_460570 [Thelonectria olida]